jgi:hypothetical protein
LEFGRQYIDLILKLSPLFLAFSLQHFLQAEVCGDPSSNHERGN